MTKNILLATAALGVLALAGTAQASAVTGAKVSGITLGTAAGTTTTFYTVANESITATPLNRQTLAAALDNTVTARPGTFALPEVFIPGTSGSTSYTATYTLTGATFTSAVVAGQQSVTVAGACTVATPTIVSGGGAGQNTVSILFTVATANGCAATGTPVASAVNFDIPFTIDAAATSVSTSVGFTISSSGAAYGGSNASAQLVGKQAGYSAGVSPLPVVASTGLPTSLSLTAVPTYSTLVPNSATNDNIIGSVTATTAAAGATTTGTVYSNLAAGTIPALTYGLVLATNGGTWSSVQPRLAAVTAGPISSDTNALAGTASGDLAAINGTNTTYSYSAVSGPRTIFVVATGTAATNTQASTGTATFANAGSTVIAPPGPSSINLETVTLQGTNFIAPWVGNAGASSTSVIRVANSGAQTGPVALTILAPVTASNGVTTQATVTRTVCTSSTLPKLAFIGANNELQLTSADFATCFGTAFTRADIRVSVQAVANNLSAKMRITNSASTTEQSLGAISADVATTN